MFCQIQENYSNKCNTKQLCKNKGTLSGLVPKTYLVLFIVALTVFFNCLLSPISLFTFNFSSFQDPKDLSDLSLQNIY